MTVNINGTSGVSGVDGTAGTPALQGTDSNTGISFGADTVNINTGGTTRATVDSSGRVLVGTSAARSNFYNSTATSQVQFEGTGGGGSSSQASVALINNSTSAGDSPYLLIGRSKGSTIGSNTVIASGDSVGRVSFQASDGTEFVEAATIESFVDGTPGTNDMPGRLVFSTTADGASSPTERMRIGQNGNTNIGSAATNTDTRLFIAGQTSDNTTLSLVLKNSAGTILNYARNDGLFSTGVAVSSPYNLTTGAAANTHVDANGILYRSTSSIRFKTDIESLEDTYADAILNIEPVWYRSTAPGDEIHPNWSYYGFIAEDVAKVDPRLVFWKTHESGQDEEGKQTSIPLCEPIAEGVQYDRFVPHLLNLIKRQQAKIESLETRLTALEGGAAQ